MEMRLSKVDPSLDMQAEKSSASQKGPRRTSRVRYELRFEAVYLSLLVFPSCTSTRTACRIVLLHYLGGSLDEERKRSGDSPLNNSILGRYVPWGRDQHNPYPSRIMRGKLLPNSCWTKTTAHVIMIKIMSHAAWHIIDWCRLFLSTASPTPWSSIKHPGV